jgi:hypothetical protein
MASRARKSNGAGGVKSSLGLKVRLVRLLRSIVPPDKRADAVGTYARAPTAAASEPGHSKEARGFVPVVRSALILYVACGAHVAEIVKTVVLRVSVFVVHGVGRPNSGHVEPRQSAGAVFDAAAPYDDPSVRLHGTRYGARDYFSAGFNAPSEHARSRIVVQDFAQPIMCDAMLNHSFSMA